MTNIRSLWWLWIFLGVSVVYFLFAVAPFVLVKFVPGLTSFSPNELGDSFGVANAFFSSLAFAGVLVTLVLQMQELAAQREEMREMQRVQMLGIALQFDTFKKDHEDTANDDSNVAFLFKFINSEVIKYARENNNIVFLESALHLWFRFTELHTFTKASTKTPSDQTKYLTQTSSIYVFGSNLANSSNYSSIQSRYLSLVASIGLELSLLTASLEVNRKTINGFVSEARSLVDPTQFDDESDALKRHITSLLELKSQIEAFKAECNSVTE